MASGLGSIEDISDQKIKIEHYKQKLSDIFSRKDEQDITAFVDHSKPRCGKPFRQINLRYLLALSW